MLLGGDGGGRQVWVGGRDRDIDGNVVEAIGGERWMESYSNVGRTDVSGVVGEEVGGLKVYVVSCASPFGSGSKVLDEKEDGISEFVG